MQAALVRWAAWHADQCPALHLLMAVPNGGARSKATAGKLKAEGVRAGAPDLILPCPRGGKTGLALEFKAGKDSLSPAQLNMRSQLMLEGWEYVVVTEWPRGAMTLIRYLGMPEELVAELQ